MDRPKALIITEDQCKALLEYMDLYGVKALELKYDDSPDEALQAFGAPPRILGPCCPPKPYGRPHNFNPDTPKHHKEVREFNRKYAHTEE